MASKLEQLDPSRADEPEPGSAYREALAEMDEFRKTLSAAPEADVTPPIQKPDETSWLRREEARSRLAFLAEQEALQKWSVDQTRDLKNWAENYSVEGVFVDDEPSPEQPSQMPPAVLADNPLQAPVQKPGRLKRLVGRIANLFRGGGSEEAISVDYEPAISPDLASENFKLLESAEELGDYLAPYYRKALELEPDLAQVALRSAPPEHTDIPRLFYAMPHWNEHAPHEVFLRLDVAAPELMRQGLDKRPAAREHWEQMLKIKPGELTPEQMLAFGMLHELGHAKEYIENAHRPDEYNDEYYQEWAEMPVPNTKVGDLDSPEAQAYIAEHWQELQEKYGVETPAEMREVQTRAYRARGREARADKFAVRIMNAYQADRRHRHP